MIRIRQGDQASPSELREQAVRLAQVRQAIKTEDAPNLGPLTESDVESLRGDPALVDLAQIAQQYLPAS